MQKSENQISEIISDELAVIEKCKLGDAAAFKILMDKHIKYVGSIAQKYIWVKEDAEEIVQEVFVKVWRNINSYDNERKFTTWLYRITVNCCVDLMRKQKSRTEFQEYDDSTLPINSEPTDQKTISSELFRLIKSIVSKLSYTQRIVFTMIDLDKNSIKETSKILAMSTNTVKANLSYARKEVRTRLAKYI